MITRRKFIQQSGLAGIATQIPRGISSFLGDNNNFSYESSYLKVQLLKNLPLFSFFSTDSLGGGNVTTSTIVKGENATSELYTSKATSNSIAYFIGKNESNNPSWECTMGPKAMTFRTRWNGSGDFPPFEITFAQNINHCTVLGIMSKENIMRFPCILHFPGMGTFRIYCSNPDVTLFYDADRNVKVPFVKIVLPVASTDHKDISYRFESVVIYPPVKIKNIAEDKRFDGFRRDYLDIFQINPRKNILANNSTSDNCAFTLFLYAEMAKSVPELVNGISAMDLIRNSLDRYIGGFKGGGQIGYNGEIYETSDSLPSLIISAGYYILSTHDLDWAMKSYDTILRWAKEMIATDRNLDGIIEYEYSGNSGSWEENKMGQGTWKRPANWWDTIGFGHDDAYSNALAYKACSLLEEVIQILNRFEDLQYFKDFSSKLKHNYFSTFYNKDTGILAGWRSSDGQLHDYYFTFINSVAICYGLIEDDQARNIMTSILSKMKEVGYTDFRLGLPGNLIMVPEKDYIDPNTIFGYGSFQTYENGGATGDFAYFTIHALFKLGMVKEAEEILMPMLESYKENSFQGFCTDNNMTKDWKSWEGKCSGYEGLLVDNYLPLLAVLDYEEALSS